MRDINRMHLTRNYITPNATKYRFTAVTSSPIYSTLRATMCTVTKSTNNNTEENVETTFKHAWVHTIVPSSLRPYFLLARVDRPIGTWLLLWPCWWSIGLASAGIPSVPLMALFGCGAILMRGAGCTFNDMVDKDIDVKVARTRTRPIASGMISRNQSVVFLGVQLSGALAVLLSLNNYSIVLGASSLLVVACYPFMKRITWYPQAWLGLAFNWGALLGWSSVQGSLNLPVVIPLYIAGIAWTIVYDTIYAHMDKSDDVFLGIGSTAIKFGNYNKEILTTFGVACIAAFTASGYAAGQTLPYCILLSALLVVYCIDWLDIAVGAAAAHLTWQISTVKLNDNKDCMRKFISNKWFGAIIFIGIILGNLFKRNNDQELNVDTTQEKKVV